MVGLKTNNESSREVHRDARALRTQAGTISIATPTCAIREHMNMMLALEYVPEAGDLPCSQNHGHSHRRFVQNRADLSQTKPSNHSSVIIAKSSKKKPPKFETNDFPLVNYDLQKELMHFKITFGHRMWRMRMCVSNHASMVRFWSGFVAWNELHIYGFMYKHRPESARFCWGSFVPLSRLTGVLCSPLQSLLH